MQKRPIKILKRDRQPVDTPGSINSGEQETDVKVDRNIGDIVGGWVAQRRENRRKEQKDSGSTILGWRLDQKWQNRSGTVDTPVLVAAVVGQEAGPFPKRLSG